MVLKYILLFVYALISIFLFGNFEASGGVWSSFFVSNLILCGITLFHVFQEKEYAPFISVFIVFNFLFFIVAPIIQIKVIGARNDGYVTNFPYDEKITVYTNALIGIFNSAFFIAYLLFKKIKPLRRIPSYDTSKSNLIPVTVITLLVISLLVFIGSFGFVQEEISRPSWIKSSASISMLLLWKKVLFLVPFAGIILCFQYLRKSKKRFNNILILGGVFLCLLALLLWFKNPLTEKRNALGPIYICLIFLFIPRLLNSNIKTLFFMFFSMVVVFPLSAILTHTTATMREILIKPRLLLDQFEGEGIAEVFNTLHYDAFANIGATIDYVSYEGYSWGYQLLSAFLFFVPRSLWSGKPMSTGKLVGEHLIDQHDFTYSNLSNPLVSEGYVNFGVTGVVFMAILLAVAIIYLMSWLRSEDYLKKIMGFYFAIHLLFLLRGDFTNGFSYYIGTLVGVVLIPRFVEYFINQLLRNQQKWKLSKNTKA